jgi:hypothetical protein
LPNPLSDLGFQELIRSEPDCDYRIYGLRVRSPVLLAASRIPTEGRADVELLSGDPAWFEAAFSHLVIDHSDWIHLHELADGWSYIRYDEMFDFLVSPLGDRILYRMLASVTSGCFQTYLLGRVFSHALVKMGHEPLHAATVIVDGRAVAFLGASAFGKSTLAASFIAAGHPVLTDDVLRTEECDGGYIAFSGPPCLKLLPKSARLIFPDLTQGVPINHHNPKVSKLLFLLPPERVSAGNAPLAAIYVLTGPRKVYRKQRIVVGSMSPREALMSLISFTHNDVLDSPLRMRRQFEFAVRLRAAVPMRSLAYPRIMSLQEEVRDAVFADLERHFNFPTSR